jgi:hypothetical protein
LIKRGESKTLEFKSTLRWSLKEDRQDDKGVTHAVLKAIAAFLNTEGGDLLSASRTTVPSWGPRRTSSRATTSSCSTDFFVRSGPGIVKLPPDSAREYVRTRFGGLVPAKKPTAPRGSV